MKPSELYVPWMPEHHFHTSCDVIDPSKIFDFTRCNRYFFFRHVLGWDNPWKSNDLTFGSAWHIAKEHIFINGIQRATSYYEAFNKFEDYWLSRTISSEVEAKYPKNTNGAKAALTLYFTQYGNVSNNWEVLNTEKWGDLDLGSDRIIRFRLDALVLDKRYNKILVVDHKTSGVTSEKYHKLYERSFQIQCYIYAAKSYYGSEEVIGAYIDRTELLKTKINHLRIPVIPGDDIMLAWRVKAIKIYDDIISNFYTLAQLDNPENYVMQSFPTCEHGCIAFGRECEYMNNCVANPLKIRNSVPDNLILRFWDPSDIT